MRTRSALLAATLTAALLPASAATAATTPALTWGPCAGMTNPRVECATVRVPLDYSRPHGRKIDIAISRLPASDPAQRRGVLITTGGGPGGPGVPLPQELATTLDPSVLARYDIIGFDMRFVERSTPISCGQSSEEPSGFWIRTVAEGSTTRAHAVEALSYAVGCIVHAGWALPHATTANVARDMDVIRAVLGERRVSFLGGSSAALLGTVYAALFPRRVDRFVLDSPLDGETVWRPYDLGRIPSMEANYDEFTTWLAANDAQYHFGTTGAAVRANIYAFLSRAAVGEVVAGGRTWTPGELGSMLVSAVFFEFLYQVVAINLAAIRNGVAPPIPLEIYPTAAPGAENVPPDNHTATSLAYRCGDNPWPRRVSQYEADVARYIAQYPAFGDSMPNITPCAYWPVIRDNRVELDGSGAPPMLFIAATRDASVPYRDTVAAVAHFPGSRLITVDAHTHVPFLSQSGGPGVTAEVTAFLTAP